jgi:hypothetical protein
MLTSARAIVVALAALAAGSVLSACSNSPSKSSSSTTTTTTPPTTSTTATTTPPTTSTTAATTTCQPSQLRVALYGTEGAAGTNEVTFSLTNSSTTVCTMYGYPGMQLLNAGRASVPTVVIRGGGLSFENVAATNVSLVPGQAAYFNLGYNDVITGTTTCSTATQVEITPPNDFSYVVVPVAPQIDACNGGTLHVSPVFASTDSSATVTTAPLVPTG